MNGWQFEQAEGGLWHWLFIDPQGFRETKNSTRGFATLVECLKDAERHGYDPDEPTPAVWADFRE